MQLYKISVFIFGTIISLLTTMEAFDKTKFMMSKAIIR